MKTTIVYKLIMKFFNKNKNYGFTLLEMLISISLFSIVVTLAFAALFTIIDANTKAKSIKSVVNNLSVTMESMARHIRVGSEYNCGSINTSAIAQNCPGGDTKMAFHTQEECNAYYDFDGGNKSIYQSISFKNESGVCETSNRIKMHSDDIVINDLNFFVLGNGSDLSGQAKQPRVIILLKGSSKKSKIFTEFNLQTTLSQRKIAP